MNSVCYNGLTLNYSTEGSGESAVLVVGSSIYYPRTFSDRLKRSLRLVCADLPHFAEFDPTFDLAAIGFEFYSECIDRVREAAGLERVIIAGHSHHGNVAVEYANHYSQYISHIVLIGSPPANIAQTVACAESYWEANASDRRKTLLEARRALSGSNGLASLSPTEAYVAQYVTDAPLYWHNPEYDAAWLWEGMNFRMEAIHVFRRIYEEYEMQWNAALSSVPTLVVMGRDDYAVPYTLWERYCRRTGPVDLRVLDRSGHTPQLEQPEEFDSTLLEWLNSPGININRELKNDTSSC